MQKEDIVGLNEVESTVATFRNFSPEKPISNAVIYYCESNTNDHDTREQHQATVELTHKVFDIYTCERYELRTGYLSRYNYLSKPINESSQEEIKKAIIKSKQTQDDWLERVKPELSEFKIKDWSECIFKEENPYFEVCRNLIIDKIHEDKEFADSFERTVSDYVARRGSNEVNVTEYVFEELCWILSLPLLHLNKPIYLIHVGAMSNAIRGLFAHFPNLQKATRWITPKFRTVTFKNKYDFLMEYRNNVRIGYSYAMENKDIVKPLVTFKKENDSTKEELMLALSREINEKNMLYSIIEKLPGHVYWYNRDNVYLGCNDLQAKKLGLRSRHDIFGKKSKQFYPSKDADIIEKNNVKVMETGEPYEGEEVSVEGVTYLTHKTPLFDAYGKVIGLLGISMDITDRKKAEQLEIENKLQQVEIRSQKKFREFIKKMAHDVGHSLECLDNFRKQCSYPNDQDRNKLDDISRSIQTIAGEILQYKKDDDESKYNSTEQDILLPLAISDIVNQIIYQHNGKNIEFNYVFDLKDKFIFMRGYQNQLDRMMLNLAKNAVEACEGKAGIIEITLNADDKTVKIGIKDSGKGMPQEMIDKILGNIPIGTNKSTGHGIGMEQIKEAVSMHNGKMSIESKIDEGTKITITFPRSERPNWIADRVTLRKGSTVVILDDDESTHKKWENLLKDYSDNLTLKFFTKGWDTEEFIDSFYKKDNIFLLSDYDLKEKRTGLEIILLSEMRTQSLVVTSLYNDSETQELIKSSNLQMFPKQFLNSLQIIVE